VALKRSAYSVGGGIAPALSSVVVTPAALLPERFRGGCAFGGSVVMLLSPAGIDRLTACLRLPAETDVGAICREEPRQVNAA
jgi:hypothetical protein